MAELVIKLVNGELAGKTMQNLTKDIRAARLEADKAKIGTQEWIDAQNKLGDAKGKLADYQKQVQNITGASDSLKKSFSSVIGQIPGFGQISTLMNGAKSSVGGLTSGFGLLRGAIIATGIGALVLLVMSLVTWFTKTEVGGDLLAKGMQILSNIFRQVTESISRLLSGDLVGFFRGVTTEMVEQVKAGNQLADLLDELEERESAFQVVQRAGLRDKAELLKMSKEENRSLEERIDAIDKARGITKGLNDQEIANQRDHLKAISGGSAEISDALIKRLEASGLTMANAKEFFKKGNITQEDLDEANQALGKFLEIQASAFDEERELLVQRNKLAKRDRSADDAAAKEAAKKKLESDLEDLKNDLDAKENLRKLEQENRLLAIADEREREKAQLEIDTQNRILELQGSETQIADQISLLREQQGLRLADIDKKYADKKAAEDKKNKADEIAREAEKNEKIRKKREDEFHYEAALNDAKLALQSTLLAGTVQLLSMDEEARKKNAAAIKAFTIGQIIVDTQREIAGYYANPASTSTLGAVGTIKTIAALVRAGLAIAKVTATKFAKGGISGGIFRGASHAHGGIPIEVEGDEIILTKGVSRNPYLRKLASNINVAAGGVQFASGGPTDPFEKSRLPVSNNNPSSQFSSLDNSDVVDKLDEIMKILSSWPRQLQVVNNLQDTQKGLRVLNKLQSDASL